MARNGRPVPRVMPLAQQILDVEHRLTVGRKTLALHAKRARQLFSTSLASPWAVVATGSVGFFIGLFVTTAVQRRLRRSRQSGETAQRTLREGVDWMHLVIDAFALIRHYCGGTAASSGARDEMH